jgi:hypothetical protein
VIADRYAKFGPEHLTGSAARTSVAMTETCRIGTFGNVSKEQRDGRCGNPLKGYLLSLLQFNVASIASWARNKSGNRLTDTWMEIYKIVETS